MSDIVRRGDDELIVHPASGELISLDAPTGRLARAIDETRELRAKLSTFTDAIARELLARMDHESQWTLRGGGYQISGTSPSVVDYNVGELDRVLAELESEELITPEARARAVQTVTTLKLDKRALAQILARGGQIAERIRAIAFYPARRITRVERTAIDATSEDA